MAASPALTTADRPAPRRIPVEERLIVALDVPTVEAAEVVIHTLGDAVCFYKIGLQLQFAGGIDLAKALVHRGKKVFLDSKLYDIEQTITGTVENIAKLGVNFLTVHDIGKTMAAAVKGRGQTDMKIMSVTVLTSLDHQDLQQMGYACSVEELVMVRAQKALDAGADGVISSGLEAPRIRAMAGDRLVIVTPGIRPAGSAQDDQKRVAEPAQAIRAGADYLVVGRPILSAPKPGAAAEAILKEIDGALRGV